MQRQRSNQLPSSRRPEKIRRALSDLNGQEINSPHHKELHQQQKHLPHKKMFQAPPPKLASLNSSSQQRKSKLPVFTMSKSKRDELRAMISGSNNYDESSSTNIFRSPVRKANSATISMQQDPEALKIRKEIERKLTKMVELEQDRLNDLESDLKEAKTDSMRLSSKITNLEAAIRTSKNQNDVNISTVATLEDKLHLENQKINSTKIHEAKMSTFKIQEEQNIIIRELDDMKMLLEEELRHAQDYRDQESEKEMVKMEEEIVQLKHALKILDESNQERLKANKEQLEIQFQDYIKEQELKNEQLTKNYDLKTNELEKMKIKLDQVKSQLKELKTSVLRIKDELKEIDYLKQNSMSIESHLLQEIERLKLEQSVKLTQLEQATNSHSSADVEYKRTVQRYTKEQTIRRKIENSIEELESKLRVYVRILSHGNKSSGGNTISFDFDHDLHQTLQLSQGETFTVNHVIASHCSNHDTYKEVEIFLKKNVSNAINVSLVLVGIEEDYFMEDLLDDIKNGLLDSEDSFQYQLESFGELKTLLIKFTKNGKQYQTRLNILNLTCSSKLKGKSFEQIELLHNTLELIQSCQYSENPQFTPMMSLEEILLHVYSTSKCLTLLSIKEQQQEEEQDTELNKRIMGVSRLIANVDALPLKRMYEKNREA